MSQQEFRQPRHLNEDENKIEDLPTVSRQENDLDSVLDEIDSVLESNASAFVQGFVQKGGE